MLYVVRHGQTDWNKEGRVQGHADVELNELGKEQAKEIYRKLKDIKFDKVFSSPLKRAYQTAKIISDEEIVVDKRLIERCNGVFEGKLKKEIHETIDFNDDECCMKFCIEKPMDIQRRVNDFFGEILDKYKHKNILIVTHGGVSIIIRCFMEGIPNDGDYRKYKLKNCEVLTYDND